MCENLYQILIEYYKCEKNNIEKKEIAERMSCKYAINFLIPITENRMQVCAVEYQHRYYSLWEKAYALAGRRSLEHFIDYMEM